MDLVTQHLSRWGWQQSHTWSVGVLRGVKGRVYDIMLQRSSSYWHFVDIVCGDSIDLSLASPFRLTVHNDLVRTNTRDPFVGTSSVEKGRVYNPDSTALHIGFHFRVLCQKDPMGPWRERCHRQHANLTQLTIY